MVMEEVKNTFNPEFLNRLDDIIVFRSLNSNDLKSIAKLMVDELNNHLRSHNLLITCTDEAYEWMANKAWEKDKKYGARPLRRVIQKYVEDMISDKILSDEVRNGDAILIGVSDNELTLIKETVAVSVI
jgi:ATP-dependent Clp protease ATP-binding subunit ClpC